MNFKKELGTWQIIEEGQTQFFEGILLLKLMINEYSQKKIQFVYVIILTYLNIYFT